jgi:hypothetical protein
VEGELGVGVTSCYDVLHVFRAPPSVTRACGGEGAGEEFIGPKREDDRWPRDLFFEQTHHRAPDGARAHEAGRRHGQSADFREGGLRLGFCSGTRRARESFRRGRSDLSTAPQRRHRLSTAPSEYYWHHRP